MLRSKMSRPRHTHLVPHLKESICRFERKQNRLMLTRRDTIGLLGSACVSDIASTLYFVSVSRNWMLAQAFLSFIIPFLGLLGTVYIIEAKSMRERLKVAAVIGVGMALGSTLSLLLVNGGVPQ